jgi:hypothetical protein
MPLQIRRGTEAERQAMTVPLAPGEPLYTTDQGFLYIGNGITTGGVQVTGYQDENAIDAVAAALVAGQNQNISFIYGSTQDITNRIDAVVDLSIYSGEISADGFRGSLFADNSTLLIDATTASINLDGTVKGNIIPDQNETYDIGSSSNRFRDLYLSGASLYLGNAQITATGTTINLPAGSTLGGSPFPVSGDDFRGNIIADDSTIMVNTSTQEIFAVGGFFGDMTGNLLGNVTGDVSGNVTGDVSGNVTGSLLGNVTGDVFGNVTGDLQGSVFGDDSTRLVDGVNSTLNTSRITISDEIFTDNANGGNRFVFQGGPSGLLDDFLVKGQNLALRGISSGIAGDANFINLQSSKGTLDSPVVPTSGDWMGGIGMSVWDGADYALNTFIISQVDNITGTNSLPGKIGFLVGDYDGAFIGASFNSRGVFESPVFKATPFVDNTARDAQIGTPTPGMIVYNTALSKFQGYVDDTGSGNPGWVNLN